MDRLGRSNLRYVIMTGLSRNTCRHLWTKSLTVHLLAWVVPRLKTLVSVDPGLDPAVDERTKVEGVVTRTRRDWVRDYGRTVEGLLVRGTLTSVVSDRCRLYPPPWNENKTIFPRSYY